MKRTRLSYTISVDGLWWLPKTKTWGEPGPYEFSSNVYARNWKQVNWYVRKVPVGIHICIEQVIINRKTKRHWLISTYKGVSR